MSSFVVTDCAEFPNDNPALHRGAIWRCEDVVGPPTCEPALTSSALEVEERDVEVVDEMTFDEIVDEAPPASAPPPVETDAFGSLVALLEEAALAAGGGAEEVAVVRALVGVIRLGAVDVSPARASALVAAGLVATTEAGLARSEALTREVLAWRGILCGESDDLAACGPAPLDEWCARLLGCALGSPARVDVLRRELRRRGVAAFGLVEVAA